jgi:hypothetical protein
VVSPKSVLLFIVGCIVGVIITVALLRPGTSAQASPAQETAFRDIPAGHVAAGAVADLKAKGILTGYSDDTFHGNRPVTRYELAVTLYRFGRYYDKSNEPLSTTSVPLPPAPSWASPARQFLVSNLYLRSDSAIFGNPGTVPVTSDQLADCLSSIFDRITDRSMPLQQSQ